MLNWKIDYAKIYNTIFGIILDLPKLSLMVKYVKEISKLKSQFEAVVIAVPVLLAHVGNISLQIKT